MLAIRESGFSVDGFRRPEVVALLHTVESRIRELSHVDY